MVEPIKVDAVRETLGLSAENLKILDLLTEFINIELSKPENWHSLFGIKDRSWPNPNPGVSIPYSDLEKAAGVEVTKEMRKAVADRFSDPRFKWDVQDCSGMTPPIMVFKSKGL